MIITALILVDMENEWINRNSEYYVGSIPHVISNVNALIGYSRRKGHKIIFIRHVEKDGDAFREKGKGSEIIATLKREKTDIVITKHTIGAFLNTKLEKELKGIKNIIICGLLTNLCVRKLAEDAYDLGYEITIVSDACCAFNKETHVFTLKDLKETRDEIVISKVEDILKK